MWRLLKMEKRAFDRDIPSDRTVLCGLMVFFSFVFLFVYVCDCSRALVRILVCMHGVKYQKHQLLRAGLDALVQS